MRGEKKIKKPLKVYMRKIIGKNSKMIGFYGYSSSCSCKVLSQVFKSNLPRMYFPLFIPNSDVVLFSQMV